MDWTNQLTNVQEKYRCSHRTEYGWSIESCYSQPLQLLGIWILCTFLWWYLRQGYQDGHPWWPLLHRCPHQWEAPSRPKPLFLHLCLAQESICETRVWKEERRRIPRKQARQSSEQYQDLDIFIPQNSSLYFISRNLKRKKKQFVLNFEWNLNTWQTLRWRGKSDNFWWKSLFQTQGHLTVSVLSNALILTH